MIDRSRVLSGLPAEFRDPLLATFHEIASNYIEHRWEPSELNGGKFCEVVFSIIDGAIKGKFPAKPTKPANMRDACQAVEKTPANPKLVGDRSFRILIPRLLPALYEIRNNRGVGHIGGDVNPNLMDATAVYNLASWILAELVRIFHGISTKEAQEVVNVLVERKSSLIWEIEDVKRVLDPKMTIRDQVLLLLHQRHGWLSDKELVSWTEYSNATVFRTKVLSSLHKARLIEYDKKNGRARISPLGNREVEETIVKSRPKRK
jgi:hypothetical protein